ncbi:hypothetical protein Chor_011505 [Crotalus horridus]
MTAQTKDLLAVEVLMNIIKAEEVQKEMELMMKPHANWEEYLMPGPISIGIFGELSYIAAGQGDFVISPAPPEGGYKYLKYPNSFQASLIQVNNSGWHAFSIAHKNMDGIRLLSMSVPEQIKKAIQILFQEKDLVWDILLFNQLDSLKSIVNECSCLAKSVESKFDDAICMIGEFLDVCTSSKSQYEQRLVETRCALEDLKLRKAAVEEAQAKAEENYKETKNRVAETFDNYRKVVDGIPNEPTGTFRNIYGKQTQTRHMLAISQQEYQKSFDILKQLDKDLLDVLSEMKKCETKQSDFETTKKKLIKRVDAFNIAQNNTHRIRLLSMSIPEQIERNIQTVFQKDFTFMDDLLPGQLSVLEAVADECLSSFKKIDNWFDNTVCLIGELLEVYTSSKSQYEQGLTETRRALEDLTLRKAAAEEALAKAKEYYKEMKNRVAETFDDYRKMKDTISVADWNNVCLQFTSTLREILKGPIINQTSLLSSNDHKLLCSTHSRREIVFESKDDFIAMNDDICAQSAEMWALVDALKTVLDDEGNIDTDLLCNKKHNEIKTVWIKNKSQQLMGQITKVNECSLKTLAMEICQCTMDITDMLTQAIELGNTNKESLKKTMNVLSNAMEIFDSRSRAYNGTSAFGPMAPDMIQSQTKIQENPAFAAENLKKKINEILEMLKMSQDEYHKSFDNLIRQNKDWLDVLNEIREWEAKQNDFERAKNVLIKGLDAMGQVKEQWEKMVRFFQMIYSLTESYRNKDLTEFLLSVENISKISSYSQHLIDGFSKQALNASNMSHLVNMISETYTEVSSECLMDKVNMPGRLFSMDPSDPQFQIERVNLAEDCDNAQLAIEDRVITKKEKFEKNILVRVTKISSELKAVLPKMTEI